MGSKATRLQLTGEYRPGTIGDVDAVVMYSDGGQITDIATIRDFLQRRPEEEEFIFDSPSFTLGEKHMFTLTITADNKVSIMTDITGESKQAEIVNRTSSLLLVAYMDSVKSLTPTTTNRCDELLSVMKKIDPEKRYTPLPLPGGSAYSGFFTFRPIFPIEIENDQLFLPITTFMVGSFTNNSSCIFLINNQLNTFNPAIVNQLQAGDTIAYQTKRVQLLKQ